METYENILVIIEEQNFVTKAIDKAVKLVQRSHGKVNILLFKNNSTINHFSNYVARNAKDKLKASLSEKNATLQKLITKLVNNGVNISTKIITCNRYSTILNEAKENNIDTILLAASNHDFWDTYQINPMDSYLIGHCPYPLLIIKNHEWKIEGNILSAVEVFNNKTEHQQLTKKILEESEHFSLLLEGNCHTLDCYSDDSNTMSFEPSPEESNKDYHLSMMKKHCQNYHLSFEQIHLSQELPEYAITKLSTEIDSELVILGDCGHRSLLDQFSVHVSEEVLNNINCDLLVLKP